MNKSYSKIRHIKEANERLEKRLLSEASLDQSKIKMGSSKLKSCFDSTKYPNLDKAANGSLKTVFGLLLMWGGITSEFLSFGLSTLGSVAVGAAGVGETAVGLKKIRDANIGKLDNELSDLWKCVFS